MRACGAVTCLSSACGAAAWLLAFPFQQLVSPSQALVQRLHDIERGLTQRPDEEGLLRLKVDTYREAGLLAPALTVCRAPRPSGRAPLCDAALIRALESERVAQASAERAAGSQGSRVFAVVIGI